MSEAKPEPKVVTLSAAANTAVQEIAATLKLPFEEALGVAIGNQAQILKQIQAGYRVAISSDGRKLLVTIPD